MGYIKLLLKVFLWLMKFYLNCLFMNIVIFSYWLKWKFYNLLDCDSIINGVLKGFIWFFWFLIFEMLFKWGNIVFI